MDALYCCVVHVLLGLVGGIGHLHPMCASSQPYVCLGIGLLQLTLTCQGILGGSPPPYVPFSDARTSPAPTLRAPAEPTPRPRGWNMVAGLNLLPLPHPPIPAPVARLASAQPELLLFLSQWLAGRQAPLHCESSRHGWETGGRTGEKEQDWKQLTLRTDLRPSSAAPHPLCSTWEGRVGCAWEHTEGPPALLFKLPLGLICMWFTSCPALH